MKNIIKISLMTLALLSLSAVSAEATVKKGQKLYLKKLKGVCGINGAIMSAKHTMAEWEDLYKTHHLANELKKVCPKAKDSSLKDKFMPHYYDFFHEYSNDSGNIPSC